MLWGLLRLWWRPLASSAAPSWPWIVPAWLQGHFASPVGIAHASLPCLGTPYCTSPGTSPAFTSTPCSTGSSPGAAFREFGFVQKGDCSTLHRRSWRLWIHLSCPSQQSSTHCYYCRCHSFGSRNHPFSYSLGQLAGRVLRQQLLPNSTAQPVIAQGHQFYQGIWGLLSPSHWIHSEASGTEGCTRFQGLHQLIASRMLSLSVSENCSRVEGATSRRPDLQLCLRRRLQPSRLRISSSWRSCYWAHPWAHLSMSTGPHFARLAVFVAALTLEARSLVWQYESLFEYRHLSVQLATLSKTWCTPVISRLHPTQSFVLP